VAAVCGASTPVSVLGFREPSAAFVLGVPKAAPDPRAMPVEPGMVHVVESRWTERYLAANAPGNASLKQIGCVSAYNVMRGCPLTFVVYAADEAARTACLGPDQPMASDLDLACTRSTRTTSRPSSKGCD